MARNTGMNILLAGVGLVGTAYFSTQALDTYTHTENLRDRTTVSVGEKLLHGIGDQPHAAKLLLKMDQIGKPDPANVDANLLLAEIEGIAALGSMVLGGMNVKNIGR